MASRQGLAPLSEGPLSFRLLVLLAASIPGVLWAVPLVLQRERMDTLGGLGVAEGLLAVHVLAFLLLSFILYLALLAFDHPDARDYAVPLAMVLSVPLASALEYFGPSLPDPRPGALQILAPANFTYDALGIVAFAAIAFPLRLNQGKPGFMPFTQMEQERAYYLARRFTSVMRQILSKGTGQVGLGLLVGLIGASLIFTSVVPFDPRSVLVNPPYVVYSPQHPLGTDELGQDLLIKIFYAMKNDLFVGLLASLIAEGLGVAIGPYSGYVGGWKDEVIMRLNDTLLSIPTLVLLIILAGVMQSTINLVLLILILGFFGWSSTARLIRAQTLSLKQRGFVERARALGASRFRILRRHILPSVLPLAMADYVLGVSGFILAASTLSFLSLIPREVPTLGNIIQQAFASSAWTRGQLLWILVPGAVLTLLSAAFALLGYAAEEVLNPKLRRRMPWG